MASELKALITNEGIRQEHNFIIKLLTGDGMMCYLLQGAEEVKPRGRINLIPDIFFYNPIYPSSQSVLPGGVIIPGMKIFGRTLMLIGGLQKLQAWDTVQFTAWSTQLWSSVVRWALTPPSTVSVGNAGRNISAIGQSPPPPPLPPVAPKTGLNIHLSAFNIC